MSTATPSASVPNDPATGSAAQPSAVPSDKPEKEKTPTIAPAAQIATTQQAAATSGPDTPIAREGSPVAGDTRPVPCPSTAQGEKADVGVLARDGASSSSRTDAVLPRPGRTGRGASSSQRSRPHSSRLSVGTRGDTGAAVAQAELHMGQDEGQPDVTVEEPAAVEGEVVVPTPAANTRSRRGGTAAASGHNINVTLNVSQAPSSSSGHVVSGSDASRPSVPPTPVPTLPAPPSGSAADAPVPSTGPAPAAPARAGADDAAAAASAVAPDPTAEPDLGNFQPAIGARRVGAAGSEALLAATRVAQRRLASEREDSGQLPPAQRRRLVPARDEPELTVGRPATAEEPLPECAALHGSAIHRRLHLTWENGVANLFGYVGEVRRLTGALESLANSPIAAEMRTQFLAHLERNFQVPVTVRSDRVMVESEAEAAYVAAMHRWLTTRREGLLVGALPPINAPATWNVPDAGPLTVRPGEPESEAYRSRRLEFLVSRLAGRFVAFSEFDIVRRERDPARRYLLEGLNGPVAVDALMHAELRGFPPLPDVVREHLPVVGIALPRVRALYYFADVLEVPEAYGLAAPSDVALFRENLLQAVDLEWAHSLAVGLEADYRATGRVIRQPSAIAAFLRARLIEREVPALNLGNADGQGVSPIDVAALVARLEGVATLTDEYLYYRVDNATAATVYWAYNLQGHWQRAGPQHRRFGGRPVNRDQEPTSRDSTPRVRQGEPGWRAVVPNTINQPLDSREIEQHLPHVWVSVRGAFRSRYTMPVRNALENMSAEIRRMRNECGRISDDYDNLDSAYRNAERAHQDELRRWSTENQRLRSERNAERQASANARAELQRQAQTIETLLGRGAVAGTPANPSGPTTPFAGGVVNYGPRPTITGTRTQPPGSHYRNADPFAPPPPRSPTSPGGY